MAALAAGVAAGVVYVGCIFCWKGIAHCRHKKQRAQQQDDVFNISSQVQGQEHQWPTHDAYVSVEHINISNQLNKPNNYNDAPPSYDEVMKIATLNASGSSTTVTPTASAAPEPKTTN